MWISDQRGIRAGWAGQRVPALCLLLSLALHWMVLSSLRPPPDAVAGIAGDRRVVVSLLRGPGESKRVASNASAASTERSEAGPAPVTAMAPAPERTRPASRESGSARVVAAPKKPPAPRADAAGSAPRPVDEEAAATLRLPARVDSLDQSASRGDSAAPVTGLESGEPRRRRHADDAARTVEQYRVALLFQARREQSNELPIADGEGRSRVRLEFASDGVLADQRITVSSGDPALDAQAVRWLARAHAQLPVPAALLQRRFAIEATISFEKAAAR